MSAEQDKKDYEDYVAYQAFLAAQTPQPGEGEDSGGAPDFLGMTQAMGQGAVNEATFNYGFPHTETSKLTEQHPTATNLGRVIGGALSGFGLGKAFGKIPALQKLMYGDEVYDASKIPFKEKIAQASKRIATNATLGGVIGGARNPHEGENRVDNALNDMMFGTGISAAGEVLQSVPAISRYLGRKIGGLNPQEADAFRSNPAKSESLFRMMTEGGADQMNKNLQTQFRGSRTPGVLPGGGLQSRLQDGVITPARTAKAAELSGVVGNLELDESQILGASPSVLGTLPSRDMSSPRKIILTPEQASKTQTAAAASAYERARAARLTPIATEPDPARAVDEALSNNLRSQIEDVAPQVQPLNQIMEEGINYKNTVDDLGANLQPLLTSDGKMEAIRSYYDRNTGSRLNRTANQLEAGRKLYGDRQMSMMNIPSLLSVIGGQAAARGMIRTPNLPRGATGLSALQAILGATRPMPEGTFGD